MAPALWMVIAHAGQGAGPGARTRTRDKAAPPAAGLRATGICPRFMSHKAGTAGDDIALKWEQTNGNYEQQLLTVKFDRVCACLQKKLKVTLRYIFY